MGLFELLVALGELLYALAEGLDLLVILIDLVSWMFSQPNRAARRAAKKADEPPPPRNAWTWAFLVLTSIAVVLTLIVLWKMVRRLVV